MANKQRSKSTSSIPICVELQKIHDQAKEIEEQWTDDLARWKNHRRSVHSNMVREREHKHAELTGGGSARKPYTPSEMQEGEREAATPASQRAASSHTPQVVASKFQPRSISLPPRSYSSDGPRAPAERAVTPPAKTYSTLARASQEASLSTSDNSRSGIARTDRTATTLQDRTGTAPDVLTGADRTSNQLTSRTGSTFASTNVTSTTLRGRSRASLPDLPGSLPADPRGTSTARESGGSGSAYKAPDPGRPIGRPAGEKSPGPLQSLHSMDTKPTAAQVSASLPRSNRRSDSSRLASVVSPRPFGTQSTRISPVSRAFTMDDSYRRFNGRRDHQGPFITPEEEARSQLGSILRSSEDKEEGPGSASFPSPPFAAPQTSSHSKLPSTASSASAPQARYEDIQIRLNQRTSSSQDFGFQTSWHATGIFIKSIQQGSSAELCQLQVGDEIVAVDSRRASEMSCEQWKAGLDSALQQGSLVLDIRRNGQNGSPENYINASNEFISRPPLETAVKSSHTFNNQANTDVESKGMNGGFRPESSESKAPEPLSLKNLKRRSEFFEQQGGSETAISDLRIPTITTSSTRHSWDPQEERKRQEKWQQEQERLLQEKYKRDQQKLEEEWRRAQQDAVKEGSGNHAENHLGVDNRSLSPVSPTSPLSQATPPPFEEPSRLEDGDELEEMPSQRAEPSKEEVERNGEGEELGLQRNCEVVGQEPRLEEEEERKMCQQAPDTCPREQESDQKQDHWRGDGFANIQAEISLSDRGKSKSTPDLDDVDKPEVRVAGSSGASEPTAPASQEAQKKKKKKKNRPVSQVEQDRLQILEEMKKKTQLLTDTSWIRQRSTNIYKEPIHLGGGMRRYESLDNLNTARSWRQSPWPPSPAPSSSGEPMVPALPTSPTPPTALNEESSPDPGPRPHSQRRRSASTASLTSGDQSLELEPELKSDCETGSSTAAPATPDSQMECLSPCDLTTLLQAEEETPDNKND
ncbi:hypothetical protein COCON_G00050640 [Conger conger]|uniref:PDZ domain-containing protein n=1 Tax=Conger conger TaxID=82655 RepID=A0A9Q1DVE7_CONCO|nr:hypothetical protein COCON_G00050640 [Conger conger]